MYKNDNNNIFKFLKKNKTFIDKNIKIYLNKLNTPSEIKKIMFYAVLGGGKGVRPFLLTETAKIYGVKPALYIFPSMAVELAHCFSLIYDDLPCMDNDELRRGKPTVHVAFNEANALLGGASLLVYAFKLLALKDFRIKNDNKLKILNDFSDVIGAEGVLAGQYLDLEAEKKDYLLTMKKYKNIQQKKTSLLLAFCTRTAGILGGAHTKEQQDLYEIGLLIGRIFQTKDDILDLEGTEKEMGKRVNKDQAKNKATMIRLKDINYAKTQLKNLCLKTKERLKGINKNTTILIELIDFLNYRKN